MSDAPPRNKDQTRVSVVMKTLESVPTCKPTESLQQAMSTMVSTKQNAVLVKQGDGEYSLLTPRCALQAICGAMYGWNLVRAASSAK